MLIVTGCCGFVGTRLTQRLLAKGYEVIGIDSFYRAGASSNLNSILNESSTSRSFRFIQADISTLDLSFINSDVTAVFHLAGQVAMTKSIENPLYDFKTNALSTVRFLEAIRTNSPRATFVYASTNKVYGDLKTLFYNEGDTRYTLPSYPQGFDETTPLDFSSPYGCSKGSADQYVRDYARIFNLRTFVFRHSSIYGYGQNSSYDQGWVGWFLKQVTQSNIDPNHKFTISGNGKQVRDILHVDDVCDLYEKSAFGKSPSLVSNIGGGSENSLSIIELLQYACKYFNLNFSNLNIDYLPVRTSDQKVFISANTGAKDIWSPTTTSESGLNEILSKFSK